MLTERLKDREIWRVMLDTNVYDLIVTSSAVAERVTTLIGAGKLIFPETHVQRDELLRIPDAKADKREAALKLPTEAIPTSAAVWGTSKWNQAQFSTSAASAMRQQLTKSAKQINDALIGVTASFQADALVTNDRTFSQRLKATNPNLLVWSFDEFVQFINS